MLLIFEKMLLLELNILLYMELNIQLHITSKSMRSQMSLIQCVPGDGTVVTVLQTAQHTDVAPAGYMSRFRHPEQTSWLWAPEIAQQWNISSVAEYHLPITERSNSEKHFHALFVSIKHSNAFQRQNKQMNLYGLIEHIVRFIFSVWTSDNKNEQRELQYETLVFIFLVYKLNGRLLFVSYETALPIFLVQNAWRSLNVMPFAYFFLQVAKQHQIVSQ